MELPEDGLESRVCFLLLSTGTTSRATATLVTGAGIGYSAAKGFTDWHGCGKGQGGAGLSSASYHHSLDSLVSLVIV